jgi:hypothetical protein
LAEKAHLPHDGQIGNSMKITVAIPEPLSGLPTDELASRAISTN